MSKLFCLPSEKGSTLKGKKLLPRRKGSGGGDLLEKKCGYPCLSGAVITCIPLCYSLVFSQSLLSLDIIEDFLHHIDEVNQNADSEGAKKEGEEKEGGEKKNEDKGKNKVNGDAAGSSSSTAGGSGEGAGDGAEKKADKVY